MMKRTALTLLACSMLAAPHAHAATVDQISVNDIHNFLQRANVALNNPISYVGATFLQASLSNNAVFQDHMATYNPTALAYDVYYGAPYYAGYYRYPMYNAISNVSERTMNKADEIGLFHAKKNDIAGYWTDISLTGADIRPYGRSAVIDVDLKEYSLGYAAYNPNLATRVMHANSKCKMYLGKSSEQVFITRMDCNTNTSMPF